ncbi:MAG TPA: hypothetical protein VFL76_03490 [Edaphocola sp.]|nr:hypothetical protein [Edaphocola sp.]
MAQVSIDTESKTITSAFLDGAGTYTFLHDTLAQTAYWDNYCRGLFIVTIRKDN